MGEVIVILPPTQAYSLTARASGDGTGSMSKEMSRGFAPGSHWRRCGFSVSSLVVGRMYLAKAMMRCRATAHPSRM